jgi:hypothetical protein
MFSDLLYEFNLESEEFMEKACIEIVKYIDDIGYKEKCNYSLFESIEKLLSLSDKNQIARFEMLIGIPMLAWDEPNYKYRFPAFGFNKCTDRESKVYEFKTTIMLMSCSCLISKLYGLKYKDQVISEFLVSIFRACSTNASLLKYISKLPSEDITLPRQCNNLAFLPGGKPI